VRATLDGYVRNGDVAGPIASRLTARLGQAARHLDNGERGKAVDALRHFVRQLEWTHRPDRVSEAARASLTHQANTVVAMLT
jgi:hypothetical protein